MLEPIGTVVSHAQPSYRHAIAISDCGTMMTVLPLSNARPECRLLPEPSVLAPDGAWAGGGEARSRAADGGCAAAARGSARSLLAALRDCVAYRRLLLYTAVASCGNLWQIFLLYWLGDTFGDDFALLGHGSWRAAASPTAALAMLTTLTTFVGLAMALPGGALADAAGRRRLLL
eukprot:SAG11_NODE_102_length_16709_cov_31.066093_1_plen_174_part_10